jgi:predicted secreted protein
MGWVSGVVVYILIWWIVIFMTLPYGNKPIESGGEDGFSGAPKISNIKGKMIVTSLISLALWVIAFVLIKTEVFDFHQIARDMMAEE